MQILSIGTIIRLKHGEHKLMIISRTPLVNENGILGYYEYGACLYPEGQLDKRNYFFNSEDIETICFDGHIDANENELRGKIEREMSNIKYPKHIIHTKEEKKWR